ncbi:hypothetical protein NPIL_351691 [Nephila pilipes]|uniref:Uncharacterized protein n=1 Tax=Nephila pilipes TaxID=299642 RepID=A0A8X6UTM8_NEPPI|nr:hypothetical protein NPIL_351691 [Nephila pilipes]
MTCSCGNTICCCGILCYCSKESCVCEECSKLIHRLCSLCGLPFHSADQFNIVESRKVCSCFIIPVAPERQILSPICNLPNGQQKLIMPQPRRSISKCSSLSRGTSNSSLDEQPMTPKGNHPISNSEQLPKDIELCGKRNISKMEFSMPLNNLPVEETTQTFSTGIEEFDERDNPCERPHQPTAPENADVNGPVLEESCRNGNSPERLKPTNTEILEELRGMVMDNSNQIKSLQKILCGAVENRSADSISHPKLQITNVGNNSDPPAIDDPISIVGNRPITFPREFIPGDVRVAQNLPVRRFFSDSSNQSSFGSMKRLMDKTFNNKESLQNDSKSTRGLNYTNIVESSKWAQYTKDWLDSYHVRY